MNLAPLREFLALLSAGSRMVPLDDNRAVWNSLARELTRIRENPHAAAAEPARYSAPWPSRRPTLPSSKP